MTTRANLSECISPETKNRWCLCEPEYRIHNDGYRLCGLTHGLNGFQITAEILSWQFEEFYPNRIDVLIDAVMTEAAEEFNFEFETLLIV